MDGDGCSATCRASGKSCADPFELTWDPVARKAVWKGDLEYGRDDFGIVCVRTNDKDLVARFVAPFDGDFAFELLPTKASAGLAVLAGPCETAIELGCSQWYVAGNTRFVNRTLAAGDVVWVRVDAANRLLAGAGDFTVRVRPAVCGDGIRVIAEECDDGNTVPGDGCSSTCELELAEVEPNQSRAGANNAALNGALVAALDTTSDEDWFQFTAVQGATYTVALSAGQRGNCVITPTGYIADLRLELFDGAGSSLALAPEPDPALSCPRLTWTAPASGYFYLQVKNALYGRAVPRYFLEIAEQLP